MLKRDTHGEYSCYANSSTHYRKRGTSEMTLMEEISRKLDSKFQEMKEQLDDLYEGQAAIKDQIRELAAALDLLSDETDDWRVE
jgi:uncharacterized protein HemX